MAGSGAGGTAWPVARLALPVRCAAPRVETKTARPSSVGAVASEASADAAEGDTCGAASVRAAAAAAAADGLAAGEDTEPAAAEPIACNAEGKGEPSSLSSGAHSFPR